MIKEYKKIIGKKKNNETDFFIFVKMGNRDGENKDKDTFYIMKLEQFQSIIHDIYSNFLLEKCEPKGKPWGKRPKNPKTTHAGIKEKDLKKYKNKWEIIK